MVASLLLFVAAEEIAMYGSVLEVPPMLPLLIAVVATLTKVVIAEATVGHLGLAVSAVPVYATWFWVFPADLVTVILRITSIPTVAI